MKTLLVRGGHLLPPELYALVQTGSTEMEEIDAGKPVRAQGADRVVFWDGRHVTVDDRRLRWPEDEDELKIYFQTTA